MKHTKFGRLIQLKGIQLCGYVSKNLWNETARSALEKNLRLFNEMIDKASEEGLKKYYFNTIIPLFLLFDKDATQRRKKAKGLPIACIELCFHTLSRILRKFKKTNPFNSNNDMEKILSVFTSAFLYYLPHDQNPYRKESYSKEELFYNVIDAFQAFLQVLLIPDFSTFLLNPQILKLQHAGGFSTGIFELLEVCESEKVKVKCLDCAAAFFKVLSKMDFIIRLFPGLFKFTVSCVLTETRNRVVCRSVALVKYLISECCSDAMHSEILKAEDVSLKDLREIAMKKKKRVVAQEQEKGPPSFVSRLREYSSPILEKIVSMERFYEHDDQVKEIVALCKTVLSNSPRIFNKSIYAFLEPVLHSHVTTTTTTTASIPGSGDTEADLELPRGLEQFRGNSILVSRFWKIIDKRQLVLTNENKLRQVFTILVGYLQTGIVTATNIMPHMSKIVLFLVTVLEFESQNAVQLVKRTQTVSSELEFLFRFMKREDTIKRAVQFINLVNSADGLSFIEMVTEILRRKRGFEHHKQCLFVLKCVEVYEERQVSSILEDVLFSQHLWDSGVNNPEHQKSVSFIGKKYSNIMMSCLILEIVSTLCRNREIRESRKKKVMFLKKTLFPVFERIGHSSERVVNTAFETLKTIAENFGYGDRNIFAMISNNSDFIFDEMIYNLKFINLFPNTLQVILNMLLFINKELSLPSSSTDEAEEENSKVESIFFYITEMMEDLLDNVIMILSVDSEQRKSTLEVLRIFDVLLSIIFRKKKQWKVEPKDNELILAITDLFQHFFGINDLFVTNKILQMLQKCFLHYVEEEKEREKRKEEEKEEEDKSTKTFKIVNSFWGGLMKRVRIEKNEEILKKCFTLVNLFLEFYKNFMFEKIEKEVWPFVKTRKFSCECSLEIIKIFHTLVLSPRNLPYINSIASIGEFDSNEIIQYLFKFLNSGQEEEGMEYSEEVKRAAVFLLKEVEGVFPDQMWFVVNGGKEFKREGYRTIVVSRTDGLEREAIDYYNSFGK